MVGDFVAGKLATFGDLDEDGEESDDERMVWREWRASEVDGLGVGGRLRGLLPNTASGQGRMDLFMYARCPGCAAFFSTVGPGEDMNQHD